MKSNIQPYLLSLLVILGTPAYAAESKPSQFISNLMEFELADRANFHSFITFEMFNKWLKSLGKSPYKLNRYVKPDDPAEFYCGLLNARKMLECGASISSMYEELTSARLELIGRDYDEVHWLKEAHSVYSELICSRSIERDYGDLVNTYSLYESVACDTRQLKQFNEELEGYHGAMFR